MSNMKHYYLTAVVCMWLTLLFSSCGGKRGHLQVDVKLDNLDQADLYVYSFDGALPQIDTIHLAGGRGNYETPLTESATFHLVYPNFQELTFWANDGDAISIEGDAQNLNVVTVSGNKDNDLYTRFRKETATMSLDSVALVAENFIREHPDSPVSLHLLGLYFMRNSEYSKGLELCQLLEQQESADKVKLQTIRRLLQSYKTLHVGATLPAFHLKTEDGKTITDKQFRGKYLIIDFWANWMGSSSLACFDTQRALEGRNHQMSVLNYSLDVNEDVRRAAGAVPDSLAWINYCDYKAWNSPLVQQLGITNLPTIILVDPRGKIVAIGCNFNRDIQPHIREIK